MCQRYHRHQIKRTFHINNTHKTIPTPPKPHSFHNPPLEMELTLMNLRFLQIVFPVERSMRYPSSIFILRLFCGNIGTNVAVILDAILDFWKKIQDSQHWYYTAVIFRNHKMKRLQLKLENYVSPGWLKVSYVDFCQVKFLIS